MRVCLPPAASSLSLPEHISVFAESNNCETVRVQQYKHKNMSTSTLLLSTSSSSWWLMGSQPQWAESSYFGILLLLSVIAERAAVRLLFVLFEVIARCLVPKENYHYCYEKRHLQWDIRHS